MTAKVKVILEHIKAGKIGCTFAAVAAKMMLDGKDMKWQFIEIYNDDIDHYSNVMDVLVHEIEENTNTLSIVFPDNWSAETVRDWCVLFNEEYFTEVTIKKGSWWRKFKRWWNKEELVGLRYKGEFGYTSWVMYFGEDAHCPTRVLPYPMITFRINPPDAVFHRVGYKDKILHIAQMATYLFNVSKFKLEKLWQTSHANSKRIIGKPLNEECGAKTTFKIKK
jgi:hypothetical protein